MRHTTIDRNNMMDLRPLLKRISLVETKFQTIIFSYSLSHIKLNLSIYSCVLFANQLTLMGFIPLGASTRTQTMLEYKNSNYLSIDPCLK